MSTPTEGRRPHARAAFAAARTQLEPRLGALVADPAAVPIGDAEDLLGRGAEALFLALARRRCRPGAIRHPGRCDGTERRDPAGEVQVRLDLVAFLDSLPPRQRSMARRLARGDSPEEVARGRGVSPARLARLRSAWHRRWLAMTGGAPERPPIPRNR